MWGHCQTKSQHTNATKQMQQDFTSVNMKCQMPTSAFSDTTAGNLQHINNSKIANKIEPIHASDSMAQQSV